MTTISFAIAPIAVCILTTAHAQESVEQQPVSQVQTIAEGPVTLAQQRTRQRTPAANQQRNRQQQARQREINRFLNQFDKNNDRHVDKTELPEAVFDQLVELDADKNGKLDATELLKLRGRIGPTGEIITGPAYAERYRDSLRVGDPAPDFTLPDPTGKREVTLSDFKGKRPVVLIFGSYT